MLLYGNTFSPLEVRLITENESFARRLPILLDRAFGLRFDRLPGEGERKYVFQLTSEEKIHRIIDVFGFDSRQSPVLHINFGLLEEECCRAAFLRGAFLAGGSVTEPSKRYHLELVTSHAQASRDRRPATAVRLHILRAASRSKSCSRSWARRCPLWH